MELCEEVGRVSGDGFEAARSQEAVRIARTEKAQE
jgi:hypothetical protein